MTSEGYPEDGELVGELLGPFTDAERALGLGNPLRSLAIFAAANELELGDVLETMAGNRPSDNSEGLE